jgi:hypothetical protein
MNRGPSLAARTAAIVVSFDEIDQRSSERLGRKDMIIMALKIGRMIIEN